MKRSNPGQLIEIRFVTNDYPSTTDKLTELDGTHSASFLSEFGTYQGRTLGQWRATSWKPWVDELYGASGLGEQEFDIFLRSLKILYGSAADFVQAHRLNPEGARLAGEIAALLPRLVADARDKDRWSRAELLHELGWRDSAVARHIHQFPVGAYVQRNVNTEHALRDAMRQHTRGYVSLVGPPGAGKSTLLQASLETEPDMFLVRYLAYVPGVGQRVGRGEADDFFDDINTHLKQTGLYGSRFRDDSLHERRAQFATLLQQAGERFARDGIRTLIVIDGLDHVPREEKPQRSFLAELPLPEAVPDGVLFVLGTQRLNLDDIKPAVQDQAGGVGRSIAVTPLAREAVYRMADLLGLDESIDRDSIFDLSNGHPLVTRYLIEAIREADSAARDELLSGSLKFDGDIETVYESAWRSIRDDEQAREVLDYLARAEGPMPLELLVQAVPEQAIERALRATRHLLSEGRHGWTVFHNSFRLFILDKPKMRFGRPDPAYSKRVYQSLAVLAHGAPGDSQQHWLELRYLARAEEHSAVLALVTPERFRQQLAERRSFAELRADLRLVFTSARHYYDPAIVFQLMLIQDEVVRRWDAYEDAPSIADALLHVGDLDAALAFVEQVPDSGYKVVDALLNAGDVSRARALFDSLEPLQQLLTGTSNGHSLAVSELDEWARRVIHFRGLDQILLAIDRVSSAPRLPGIEVTQADVNALVAHLKGEVAFAIIDAGDDVDATEVSRSVGIDAATFVTVLIRSGMAASQRGANEAALAHIRGAFAHEVFPGAPNALRRGAALAAARSGDLNLAAEIHRDLTTPVLADLDRLIGDDASEHMARAVLEHAELIAMLGQKASTVHASDRRALRPLQFHSVAIGEVLGRARRDPASVHANEVARVAQAALTYLDRVQADGVDELYALHQIAAATPILGEVLIQAAAQCGEREFLATIKEFDSAFAQPDSTNGSRTNLRRVVAIQIYQCTGDTEEASRRLEELVVTLVESTPAQQIEGIADLAVAFAQVGNIGRAKELLACVPEESLGYARPPKKDPQYATWRELLQQANRVQPANRSDRVAFLLRQVAGMMQTEGRDSAYRIAQVLLEEAMLCDPSMGWLVGRGLVDDGAIGWALMVDALMLGLVRRRPDLTLVATVTWCELALPYYSEPYYNESRLGEFVAAAIEEAALEDVGKVIDTLLLAIEAEARVHERVGLLDRLCKAAKSRGIASQLMDDTRARWAAEAPRPRHSYTPMRYDDVLTLSDLKRRLEIDDLAGEVSYDAPNAFCRVVTDVDYALAKEVFDQWGPIQRNSRARFLVTDLAIAAGQLDVARQLMDGYNGDSDEPATWTSWAGGGLQRYFRAKIKLEGAKVYGEAYDNFVGGLASGRDSASSALLEFEDIFPTLIESPDWANMWDSLAEQLAATREYAMGSAFAVDGRENLSDEELIGALFVWALDLSIAEVHRHVVSGALRLRSTKGGSTVFALLIRRLLSGQADKPAEGIQLLLLEEEDSLASELGGEVVRLTKHGDYAVAVGATILAKGWGLSPDLADEPLPFFYSLVLDDGEDFGRPQFVDAFAGPMRVEDPLGWTFAFRDQIKFLSQSGISSSHIRHRCRMFIEQWGGLDAFGQKATWRLERDLRNLDMKMLYARPHIVVAARALRYVAEEMRRGGVIPDEVATELLYMLGYPASRAPIMLPVPRPAFIQRPARDETRWREEEETWLNGVNDDLASLEAGTDIIFAEVSEFHIRKSGRVFSMERVRAQALTADSTRLDLNAFTLLPDSRWAGYPVPMSSLPANTIVRRVSASWNPEVPRFRLAICAHWLKRLEWFEHPTNALIYEDKSGAIVSRIVWWRDGGPVDIDDDVIWGEGTYLNLTPTGRRQIEALIGPLKINVYSRRSCHRDLRDSEVQVRVAVSTD
ncbi:ATP-binding protein [Burkholderia cepacia]|uniref:ATP-binding protein n=1 Tax=Burkholderia cepacia TaxID=292 RepID=UPI0011B4CD70|nr:ATP-binding protein [Burkholderia cepacia]MDN7894325.1 ATP-binding protein [Burkholderia cepacia]